MRTVAFYSIDGVSKAKTAKAILVQRQDGKEAWIPMSSASVKFTGPNYKVRVSVPDWLFSKISWKNPTAFVRKAVSVSTTPAPVVTTAPVAKKNPYIGMDYGNMMEESMVLSEMLSHKKIEFGECLDSDDPTILDPLSNEIKQIEGALIQIAEAMKVALK